MAREKDRSEAAPIVRRGLAAILSPLYIDSKDFTNIRKDFMNWSGIQSSQDETRLEVEASDLGRSRSLFQSK